MNTGSIVLVVDDSQVSTIKRGQILKVSKSEIPLKEKQKLHFNIKNGNFWYFAHRFIELTRDNYVQEIDRCAARFDLDPNPMLKQAEELLGIKPDAIVQVLDHIFHPHNQQPTTDDMKNYESQLIAKPTLLRGKDISDMTEAECVQQIKTLKAEIAALKELDVQSPTIDKRVAEREEAIQLVVAQLNTFA